MKPFLMAGLAMTVTLPAFADIEGCSDGNTCFLREPNFTGNIHLFCIEAPSLAEPFGKEARDALRVEVHGTVRVLMDHMGSDGLPVAELIRNDGLNLGLNLVDQGLAKVVPGGCDDPAYAMAESDAQKARLSIWSETP